MRRSTALLASTLAFLLGGCAALDRSSARLEARQLAWTGPGAGPCLFGGVTARADEHCARINFGPEGVLQAVNERVRAGLPASARCTDHVAAAQLALARHGDLRSEPVYSCPESSRARGECHVSVLVTLAGGERYVLDNGSVVNDAVGADGVARFEDFDAAVAGIRWIGAAPTLYELSAAMPGFTPVIAARR